MMLQRAASNAYSWWWASHIRTKQSKWLEQNLQDMEEKVQTMLKLIEEDGDSFAKRAEMYYKKRPELINFVEESYRAYRSLAERYDHISTELQNANTTIASVFPDQVQFAMDDDDDDPTPRFMKKSQDSSTSNIPNVPKMPIKDIKGLITTATKKLQPKKLMKYKNLGAADNSGIGKSEAMQEIDKLQKEILTLQTEKEFVKSSYESGLAKYWEIEKHIKEKQERICSLQDEFGTSMAIEDDEARRLMASTALKSCQEKLDHLQEEQEKSAEEAKVEHQRIRNSREKLEFLKDQLLVEGISQEKSSVKDDSAETAKQSKELEYEIDKASEKRKELDSLREKIKEHFVVGANASLTVTEMAEKIDELVNKVIRLETAVSSQTALIQRLRTETDELQAQIQTLEDDKVTLMDDKNYLCKKLRELQEKLHGLQGLDLSVKDQGDNLQTHFTEARCSLDHISDKLQTVKPDEEAEVTSSSLPEKKSPVEVEPNGLIGESAMDPNKESKKLSTAKEYQELNVTGSAQKEENVAEVKSKDQQEKLDQGGGFEAQVDVRGQDLSVIGADQGENISKSQASDDLETLLGKQVACKKVDDLPSNEPDGALEKQTSHKKCDTVPSNEPQEQKIQKEDEPNWKELFLNSLKDREKLLLTEYTTVLRNYKEVKKKFNEAEVKLKNTKTVKDEEIKSLNQKLSLLEAGLRDNNDMKEFKPSDNQQEQSVEGGTPKTRQIYEEDDFGMMLLDQNQTASPIEEQFRMNIDELLEENLDFWLRFSTSFHQIQKFDTGIQDLQSEISKLEERKKQDGSSTAKYAMRSDVRPIYRHLREIHAELTVWLEKSALLKDELKSRFSSLCNIQDEITKALKASAEDYDFKFTSYQAAKFQGEILNMKQENNKVADELQAGLDHITTVQLEVEKTLTKLTEDFALSGSKKHPNTQLQHSDSKSRVPLRSFIFGVKPKKQKQSIFSCMHPSLYRKIKTTSS